MRLNIIENLRRLSCLLVFARALDFVPMTSEINETVNIRDAKVKIPAHLSPGWCAEPIINTKTLQCFYHVSRIRYCRWSPWREDGHLKPTSHLKKVIHLLYRKAAVTTNRKNDRKQAHGVEKRDTEHREGAPSQIRLSPT